MSKAYPKLKLKELEPLTLTNPAAPASPRSIPAILYHFGLRLKKSMPVMSVNNGVSELRIPARELSIPRCAAAKRKAGARLPTMPTTKSKNHCRELNLFTLRMANGKRKSHVITILRAPTSLLVKVSSPLFIKIKELPQVRAKKNKIM